MPSAWSVNTDQRHHTILKTCLQHDQWTQTNDITLTILKTCLDHDQWTQTNDITLSWKHAFSMISEHRPTASHYPENMPSAWSVNTDQRPHTILKTCLQHDQWTQTNDITLTILKTCLDHDQWTQTNDITLSWKHAFSMISEHRPTASHYPENMPSAWSVNTDQRHHTILKTCLQHDQWTQTNDITPTILKTCPEHD